MSSSWKKVHNMEEYVEEAKRLGYVYYYADDIEIKEGKNKQVDGKKIWLYQFEWRRILKPYVDFYEDGGKFKSIEDMIKHVNEDGTCLLDYLEKHNEFPNYIAF